MSSNDDSIELDNTSTLIFGMGVGTFLVFFFAVVISFIWFFSTSCLPITKVLWRSISVFLFIVIMLILVFAPRSSSHTNTGMVDNQYDHSIIPRIAISLVTILFGILASVLFVGYVSEPINLSSTDQEHSALWQDEY